MSDQEQDCPLVAEDDDGTCPAGLPVPRGTVLTRRALRSVAVLALLGFLFTAANLLWTAHEVRAVGHDFCGIVAATTAVPVPKPANAAANPSREQNYEWYQRFVRLGHDLGC